MTLCNESIMGKKTLFSGVKEYLVQLFLRIVEFPFQTVMLVALVGVCQVVGMAGRVGLAFVAAASV